MATSYAQMSLADLEKEKARIEKAIERKSGQERNKILAKIESIAKRSGFNLGELLSDDSPEPARRTKKKAAGKKSAVKGRKVPPKYRNPNDETLTWTGRGRTPLWMVELEKKGKKRDQFLIK